MSKAPTRRQLALALALTPGVGGKTVARTLTRNDLLGRTPGEVLRLGVEALREDYRFPARGAASWVAARQAMLAEADRLQTRLDPHGVSMVTSADASYPSRIEEFDPNPPGLIYLYGNLKLLHTDTFAILSSRKTSSAGLDLIERATEAHVLAGRVLVSGHDTPEYQRAAVVPLRWGAPRILVLDVGMIQALGDDLLDEPFRAARLWRFRFDPLTDLAISTVNPEAAYHRESNRIRDRLVGSLAMRLDGVEVSPGGNMHRLAALGLRAGREVRVHESSQSFESLAAIGAKPLELPDR